VGRHTLKITIHEQDQAIEIKLEGRVAGRWVPELQRVWAQTAPQASSKTVSIDIQDVTYADAGGKQALRHIYAQTRAELIASSPWSQYLAEEIRNTQEQQ
jgi:anti-anti-sigma regulatory factor